MTLTYFLEVFCCWVCWSVFDSWGSTQGLRHWMPVYGYLSECMMSQGPEQKVLVWRHIHAPLLKRQTKISKHFVRWINLFQKYSSKQSGTKQSVPSNFQNCIKNGGPLPLSRLSRYSAACKRAAMLLIFRFFFFLNSGLLVLYKRKVGIVGVVLVDVFFLLF